MGALQLLRAACAPAALRVPRRSGRRLSLRAALLFAALVATFGARADDPPNVLVILADDLGYSDLGAYGSEIATPNLDRLAAEGALFTNFHSTPLCSPTRAELMTGVDHHLAGLGGLFDVHLWYQKGEAYEGLNRKAPTVAAMLRDAGYHTYMAGKWHLSTQGPEAFGFERAFYMRPDAGSANYFAALEGRGNTEDVTHFENGVEVKLPADFYSSDAYTDKLIGYIDHTRADHKPFFAYLAFQAVHLPLQVPGQYLERQRGAYDAGYEAVRSQRIEKQKRLGLIPLDFRAGPALPWYAASPTNPFFFSFGWDTLTHGARAREARQMEIYAAMVENLDDNVGRLLDYLRRAGLYDKTLIAFTSDNGPDGNGDLDPNGYVDNSLSNYGRPGSYLARSVRWAEVSSAPFRGFKASVAEGGTSVPAIVRLPESAPPHAVIGGLASVLDLVPTILAATGTNAAKAGAPREGVSLLPALRNAKAAIRGPDDALADEMYNHRYVIKGSYKVERTDPLFYGWSFFLNHDWQLYDIKRDRGETSALLQRGVGESAAAAQDANAKVMDGLIQDWDAYARRTGVVVPGR